MMRVGLQCVGGGGGLAFPFKLKKMLLLFIHRKQELSGIGGHWEQGEMQCTRRSWGGRRSTNAPRRKGNVVKCTVSFQMSSVINKQHPEIKHPLKIL